MPEGEKQKKRKVPLHEFGNLDSVLVPQHHFQVKTI